MAQYDIISVCGELYLATLEVDDFMSKLWAILTQRCPRCQQGQVFARLIEIHANCPHCQLLYEREPGYFTGAMYLSYGMAVMVIAPFWLLLYALGTPYVWNMILAAVALVLASPIIFRYSRVLWLYIDQAISPR